MLNRITAIGKSIWYKEQKRRKGGKVTVDHRGIYMRESFVLVAHLLPTEKLWLLAF